MKKYGDEDFIFLINEETEEENRQEEVKHENNINDGYIIINEEKIIFKEVQVSEGEFSMLLPDKFDEMSDEMAQIKYPSQNRPDFILTNPETTINLTFSHKTDKIKNKEIEKAKNAIQELMQKMQPASKVIDSKVIEADGQNIAYFDFISPAIDTEIYNCMFFFSLCKTLLIGSFNCLQQDMKDWKDICIQMLHSVKFINKK